MKKVLIMFFATILFNSSIFSQCSCYSVEDLDIIGQDSMELVLSNSCDGNAYLNLYVISSTPPFDTLGKQELWSAFIFPFNTNVSNILSTSLTSTPAPGTYRVSITNGTLVCDSVMVSQTLNTTNIQYNTFKSMNPNPFNSETTLQFDHFLNNASLTVYNGLGQTVKQITNIFGETITLERGHLIEGVYFIRLTQDNKIIATDKVLIKDN